MRVFPGHFGHFILNNVISHSFQRKLSRKILININSMLIKQILFETVI